MAEISLEGEEVALMTREEYSLNRKSWSRQSAY